MLRYWSCFQKLGHPRRSLLGWWPWLARNPHFQHVLPIFLCKKRKFVWVLLNANSSKVGLPVSFCFPQGWVFLCGTPQLKELALPISILAGTPGTRSLPVVTLAAVGWLVDLLSSNIAGCKNLLVQWETSAKNGLQRWYFSIAWCGLAEG